MKVFMLRSTESYKHQNQHGKGKVAALVTAFRGFARPDAWRKNVWELDPNNTGTNSFQNEVLIVWMRTAALPTFRKLYRRVDHTKTGFKDGLPKGKYTLFVNYCKSVVSHVFLEDTVRSKGYRTEFFTAFLPTPSTWPRLNYVAETVSHKSANWRIIAVLLRPNVSH
jgi:hypothetical protein